MDATPTDVEPEGSAARGPFSDLSNSLKAISQRPEGLAAAIASRSVCRYGCASIAHQSASWRPRPTAGAPLGRRDLLLWRSSFGLMSCLEQPKTSDVFAPAKRCEGAISCERAEAGGVDGSFGHDV